MTGADLLPLFASAPESLAVGKAAQREGLAPVHLDFLAMAAVFLVVYVGLALIVAVQARRRGYALTVWLIASLVSNPIFLLLLLGVMPDFARRRLRETEMKDLESRLMRTARRATAEAIAPAADLQRSLGDQVTALPERSLGDVETRL
jgi:hypothetical protein